MAGLDVLGDVRRPARRRLAGLRIPEIMGMDLVGEVAFALAGERMLGIDPRRADIGIGAGVGLDPVAGAAHQLVDRQSHRPAGKVPQHQVDDARDILRDVGDPQPFPDQLAVVGVLADQQRAQAAEQQRLVGGVQPLLVAMGAAAEEIAGDALVGLDARHRLHQLGLGLGDRMAHVPAVGMGPERDDFHVGDLHALPLPAFRLFATPISSVPVQA